MKSGKCYKLRGNTGVKIFKFLLPSGAQYMWKARNTAINNVVGEKPRDSRCAQNFLVGNYGAFVDFEFIQANRL